MFCVCGSAGLLSDVVCVCVCACSCVCVWVCVHPCVCLGVYVVRSVFVVLFVVRVRWLFGWPTVRCFVVCGLCGVVVVVWFDVVCFLVFIRCSCLGVVCVLCVRCLF